MKKTPFNIRNNNGFNELMKHRVHEILLVASPYDAFILEELKNLDLSNPELQKNIKNLSTKQNQLEIEKIQIEDKYKKLLEEHENLSKKLEDLKNKEKIEERKQIEFSEKIDELNQETETLLDEIDKWQM